MKKRTTIISAYILLFSAAFSQTRKDVDINFMLQGHIFVHSSIGDSTAYGGFGSSDNFPKIIARNDVFSGNGIFLKVDTAIIVTYGNRYNGYNLYLCNKSDTTLRLVACDSRIDVIAEVFYNGEWRPIEYLPASWCGNSYHRVFLKQNEYWEFIVPKFSGKIKAQLRYSLMIGPDQFIYSNEITTFINQGQMTKIEGHKPKGIMDPYND